MWFISYLVRNHVCFLGFSGDLFLILNHIPTVFSITCKGHIYKYVLYIEEIDSY